MSENVTVRPLRRNPTNSRHPRFAPPRSASSQAGEFGMVSPELTEAGEFGMVSPELTLPHAIEWVWQGYAPKADK